MEEGLNPALAAMQNELRAGRGNSYGAVSRLYASIFECTTDITTSLAGSGARTLRRRKVRVLGVQKACCMPSADRSVGGFSPSA